jgi:hypothetical protein
MNTHISNNTYEALYLKEKQKSKILMAASGLLAIALVGSVIYFNDKSDSNSSTGDRNVSGQFSQNGMNGGMGGPGGSQMDIKDFFNSDGSVNSEKVTEITSRTSRNDDSSNSTSIKTRMLERLDEQISTAVTDGDITSSQASALRKALGI